jgi:hypothetical protein
MAIDVDVLQKLQTEEPEVPPMDLSWLNLDQTYGVQAKPGRRGLTLDEVNIGVYGDAPEHAANQSFAMRGSVRRLEAPRLGLKYSEKADVWSNNCALLYEEAVQRQWSSATDIPWSTIEPLPDELERAMCQLCTFLTEVEFIAGDVPGQWLPRISPDHYEVGLVLMAQIMDEARHTDVFRKRALANGGGLLEQGQGTGLRNLLEADDFTMMSVMMHVQAEGGVQSLFRMGEMVALNEAEKRIYRLCAQDESRHLAFGVMHLKYVLESQPERREEIHSYLDKVEELSTVTGTNSPQFSEALVVLFGKGTDAKSIDEGRAKQLLFLKKQLNEYMHRLEVAGLGDRRERVHPVLRQFLDPARN